MKKILTITNTLSSAWMLFQFRISKHHLLNVTNPTIYATEDLNIGADNYTARRYVHGLLFTLQENHYSPIVTNP